MQRMMQGIIQQIRAIELLLLLQGCQGTVLPSFSKGGIYQEGEGKTRDLQSIGITRAVKTVSNFLHFIK